MLIPPTQLNTGNELHVFKDIILFSWKYSCYTKANYKLANKNTLIENDVIEIIWVKLWIFVLGNQ